MSSKFEKIEGNRAKLTIEISPEDFKKGLVAAYTKTRGKYNVPGFRKGKAPRKLIETYYGEGAFYEAAIDEVFPGAYEAAIEEHKLDVVSQPTNFNPTKIGEEEGLEFSVEADLKPEVTVENYKGIEVTKPIVKITAKDVDAEIEKVRNENVRWIEVEREVKSGDTVVMDYSGSVDGKKFDGGTAEGQTLVIGSQQFIPGFEEQLIGMKPGEKKDITVTFPKEYPAPDLSGKEAVFAINMISVKEKEIPAVDDDFAADVSEFDTLAEYKKDVKKNLTAKAEENAKNSMEDQLLKKIVEMTEIDIPKSMIDSQTDQQIQEFAYQLMYQGMKIDDYLKYTGKTIDDMRADYADRSKEQVKMRLCIDSIIKQEGIEASDAEVDERIEKFAKDANKTLEEYKELIKGEIAYFKERVCVDKMFDMLVANAKITEVAEEKPAKKAKKADEAKEAKAEETAEAKEEPAE